MSIDTKQKRMSTIERMPWRSMVDPAEAGFNAGNRRAASFLYAMTGAAPTTFPRIQSSLLIRRLLHRGRLSPP